MFDAQLRHGIDIWRQRRGLPGVDARDERRARVGGQVERDAARVDRGGRIRARLLDAVETLLPRMRDAARAGRRRDPCGAGVRRGAGLHAQHAIGVRGRNSV
ncbi:hypothetical protein [Burkholderia vietnamiensis]|uniref:hypothetical protein n=1 Tax=Burkholderia vietnamiensis TaxID=60552 RepID=UPI001F467E52|nr:hypothetical protein [Burkholderia vietnamiensis]